MFVSHIDHAIPAYYFQSNPNNSKPLHEKVSGTIYNHLSKNLGISDINCVPVNHCAHAFAVVMVSFQEYDEVYILTEF